jgi:hypothetical protein
MKEPTEQIREWFDKGKAQGATHLLVFCDTFNFEQYPVYVFAPETWDAVVKCKDNVNMQRVEERYDLAQGFEPQARSYNRSLPPPLIQEPRIRDNPPRNAELAVERLKFELSKLGVKVEALRFENRREFNAFPGGGFVNYLTDAIAADGASTSGSTLILTMDTCLMENAPQVAAVEIQERLKRET